MPALLGALLAAPQRRQILCIGDGSFQVTAQELSTILRHNLKPIIILINNDGYTVERMILGENATYNDINMWRYARLGEVLDKQNVGSGNSEPFFPDILNRSVAPGKGSSNFSSNFR